MGAAIHSLDRGGATIAYRREPGCAPGVVFLGGFRSDMTGTKAAALEQWAAGAGHACVRFDYQGHGASSGRWEDCTIGGWLADTLAVLDALTEGPQILVGSSMGGWLALLAALARPRRVTGLVAMAPAVDFTERLIWNRLSPEQRRAVERDGRFLAPSAYDPAGYPITRTLIEEGRRHLLLDGPAGPIALDCPVRLLHGQQDADVPWQGSLELAAALATPDVRLTLVKDGDHRLSRPQDLVLLTGAVAELAAKSAGQPWQ
ncbi:alpha/beta hydrolase [Oleisolibacter albus]|uniref:alpha/beta hydrolase n=1 Tax=Oleisolibacter albus TaxID=2171757 RepID=UPI000DF3D146|nr:alpha/beta hydrolase [Oleisolibacter albus]